MAVISNSLLKIKKPVPYALSGVAPAAPLTLQDRVAFIGDSLIANGIVIGSSSNTGWQTRSFPIMGLTTSGFRLFAPATSTQAVSGASLDDILTSQVPAVLALAPKLIIMDGGTNDLPANQTASYIASKWSSIFSALLAGGVQYIIMSNMATRASPNALTGPQEAVRVAANTLLASMATDRIKIIDASSAINPATHTIDGLHYNTTGANVLGAIVKPVIDSIVSGDVLAVFNNDFAVNPNISNTAGVADNFTLSTTNSGGATVGVGIATVDGRPWAELTLSGAYTGNSKEIYYNTFTAAPGAIVAGDKIEGIAELEVESLVGVRAVTLNWIVYDASYTVLGQAAGLYPGDTGAFPTGITRMVQRTTIPIVAAGTPTYISFGITVGFIDSVSSTPVSGKVRLGRNRLREIDAPPGPVNIWADSSIPSNFKWSKFNVTTPGGGLGANGSDTVRETIANDEHSWKRVVGAAGTGYDKPASAINYKITIRFKPISRTRLILYVFNDDASYSAASFGYFFTSPPSAAPSSYGGMGTPTVAITAVADGFFEATMAYTSTTATTMPVAFYVSDADYNQNYTGDILKGFDVAEIRLELN